MSCISSDGKSYDYSSGNDCNNFDEEAAIARIVLRGTVYSCFYISGVVLIYKSSIVNFE